MNFKKIDKRFLLTDNTLNCYSYRLLTSGYQIEEFKRNPIGYYMHNREDGVLVKWEDFEIENDRVYAKPVINLNHPRGQQIVSEIENGFLNAASVGHIVALEQSDDTSLKLPGQTNPTVTKWYNRECSIVDVPGNYNALAQLYDKKGQVLMDLSDTKRSFNLSNTNLRSQIIKLLSLPDNLTDEQIINRLELLLKSKGSDQQAKLNNLIDMAVKSGKITKEQSVNYLRLAPKDPHAVKDLLDSLDLQQEDKLKKLIDEGLQAGKYTKEASFSLLDLARKDYQAVKTLIDRLPKYVSIIDRIDQSRTDTRTYPQSEKPKSEWNLSDYRKHAPGELKRNKALYNSLIEKEDTNN